MPAPTVLIAEDDPGLRSALSAFLRGSGYTVIEAGDGLEAERRMLEADILILDISLPEKSGVDLLREIRSSRPGVPVVLMSGRIEQYLESGEREIPTFTLRKPFDPEALLADLMGVVLVPRKTAEA